MRTRRFVPAALLALAALLATPGHAAAQATGQIGGTVTDSSSGTPIVGALVSVMGTTLGASTGADGRYLVTGVPAGTHTVQVRRLGFTPRNVPQVVVTAGQRATVDVRLRPTALQLEAVVTTGVIGPTQNTRVPFTVGRVNAADLPVPATNAVESIQGKMAGVNVIPSAQPGTGTNIILRTPTSINKSNSPLIVVDGVIQSQSFGGSSADLESLDIESIEVVKGAAAASLYGSRAASGVIQIRTRRGAGLAEGATNVTVRSEIGSNALSHKVDWAKYHFYLTNDAGQYVDEDGAVVDRDDRVAKPAYTRFQDSPYPGPVYDPVEQFFDPGQFFTNSINVAQNAGKTNWFASFVDSREDGVVLGNGGFQRRDVRLNLDHRPTDQLTFSFSGYHSRSNRDELGGETFFDLINQAPDINLQQPDPDGTPYIYQADPEGREENPLYVLVTEQNATKRARTQGSIEARYEPLAWLSFDGNISYDRSDRRQNFFLDRGVKTEGFAEGGPGEIEEFAGTTSALNSAASMNLTGTFGELTARTTIRGLLERETNQTTTASGTNLSVPGVSSLDNAQERTVSSATEEIRSDGFFVIAGLDYGGRYIADGLFRRDGSSLFGPDERWNSYYRISGAYRMAEEPWWPWASITEFKLRASRGTAGGRPDYDDQYETYDFLSGGGVEKATLGNRALKPELATETEVGIDAIFRDRYSLQLSYARNKVEDQLILIPLAGLYGYTSQWQNAGTVEGNTLEGTFEAQILASPNFNWRLGLIADRTRNRITEFDRSCFQTQTIAYRCAGVRLGDMYGYHYLNSVDELPADAAARATEFQVNDEGLLVWVGPDASYTEGETKQLWGTSTTIGTTTYGWGMPITLLNEAGNPAVVRIGDGNADFHFGVSNTFRWRDLSVYALVDAQVGGNAYNQTRQRMYQYGRHGDVDQVGKPQELKKPVDYYSVLYNANNVVDYFVEDAGFVKLRELSMAYTVPTAWLSRLGNVGVQGVRLSLIGRNLLTFTDYKGYDPEVGSALTRLDSFDYPRYRTITGAIEITF
ncbi:MAG TPA: SusC/RagA family TonB-linked outer membrane protein [Gemmatimonadaceae bacterium]|nr:SusC/RagA family TonB-linked outer membrane protein [Gemmatimonadaceae bacterium]